MNRTPSNEQIEQRAYEIYLQRGCENGHDMEDWLSAEQELSGRREEIEAEFAQEPAGRTASKKEKEYAATAGRGSR